MKNIKRGISTALSLCALTMLISCSQQKAEWKGTIEDVDEVKIVNNPKEPMYGENICIIEEDEEGFQTIKRYKVIWKY
jgi:hypothetical protein